MSGINRGRHFLLTEAVKKTVSQNGLTEASTLKILTSVNIDLNDAVIVKKTPRLID